MSIVAILDEVAKFMNEHASAQVLRERVLFAKDQEAAQEKRISDLERQVKEAESENAALRLKLKEDQAISQNQARHIQELETNIRKHAEKPVNPRFRIVNDDADLRSFPDNIV